MLPSASIADGAPKPVLLSNDLKPLPLGGNIAMLRDKSGKLGLTEIRSGKYDQDFINTTESTISNGFTDDAYWYRVSLINQTDDDANQAQWVLTLTCPWLDYVDFYVINSDGVVQSFASGDRRELAPGEISYTGFAVPIRISPGDFATVYLRVQTGDQHLVELQAWSAQGFLTFSAEESLWKGIVFGILLVMALYNFFIFSMIWDKAYFLYVLYIVSVLINLVVMEGTARQISEIHFGGPLTLIDAAPPWLLWFTGLFAALFTIEFLQVRQNSQWLYRGLSLLAGAFIAGMPLLAVLPMNTSIQLAIIMVAVCAILLLISANYLVTKGVRAATFYLVAQGMLLAGYVLYVFAGYGLLPLNFFTAHSIQIGACLDVMLLSFALGDRIRQERSQRYFANEYANKLKSFLPEKVAELVMGRQQDDLLEPKRQMVTVCVIDLRGFTPFSEAATPEDVLYVLREFFSEMGKIVERHDGAVEHFAGDGMVVFFNAPVEIENPELQAVTAAIEMRQAFKELQRKWKMGGFELGLGIGIADGYASVGVMGFSGRMQYAAIGVVTNLAARLCNIAAHGEILVTRRVLTPIAGQVQYLPAQPQKIKGFSRPIEIARIEGLASQSAAESLSQNEQRADGIQGISEQI